MLKVKLSKLPKSVVGKLKTNDNDDEYVAIAKGVDGWLFFLTRFETQSNGEIWIKAFTEYGWERHIYPDEPFEYEIEETSGKTSEIFEKYGDVFALRELPKHDFPNGTSNAEKAAYYESLFLKEYADLFDNGGLKVSLMTFGFDGVGLGWYPILLTVFEELRKNGTPFKFIQIKEKFGGLRMYHHFGDIASNKLIAWAEAKSERVCENCGQPGQTSDIGWIFTLCKDCLKEKIEERK